MVQQRMRGLKMMKYKGYIGKAEYDDEAEIFSGEVIGLGGAKVAATFLSTDYASSLWRRCMELKQKF